MSQQKQTVVMPLNPGYEAPHFIQRDRTRPEGVKYFLSESRFIMGTLIAQDGVVVLGDENIGVKLFEEMPRVGEVEFDRKMLVLDGSRIDTTKDIDTAVSTIDEHAESHGRNGVILFNNPEKFVVMGANAVQNQAQLRLLRAILPKNGVREPDAPRVVVAAQVGKQAELAKQSTSNEHVPDIIGSFDEDTQRYFFKGIIQPMAAVAMLRSKERFSGVPDAREALVEAMEAILEADQCNYATVKRVAETNDWSFLKKPTPAQSSYSMQREDQGTEPANNRFSQDKLDTAYTTVLAAHARQLARSFPGGSVSAAPDFERALQDAGEASKRKLRARDADSLS